MNLLDRIGKLLRGATPEKPTASQSPTARGLLGASDTTAPPYSTEPLPPPDTKQEQPLPVYPKVLMIVHDPPIVSEGNKSLIDMFQWNAPDRLAKGYSEDLKQCSGGYLNYEIVDRIDDHSFPPKVDGFRYTEQSYLADWRKHQPRQPDMIDYHAQIQQFDLQNRFNKGDFDEVWFFSFPFSGGYESIMGGPGAFWCNSPALTNTDRFRRRFVMMHFNYERGVDCMLENFGHRTESIMTEVYKRRGKEQDMWKLFTRYDKIAPSAAQCGNVHFAPNSTKDYEWGNPTPVRSFCDDWYTYPTLPGHAKIMTDADWGNGDMRLHHIWWLNHLPKTTGETRGVQNNWWEYVVDPNKV